MFALLLLCRRLHPAHPNVCSHQELVYSAGAIQTATKTGTPLRSMKTIRLRQSRKLVVVLPGNQRDACDLRRIIHLILSPVFSRNMVEIISRNPNRAVALPAERIGRDRFFRNGTNPTSGQAPTPPVTCLGSESSQFTYCCVSVSQF